MSHPLLHRLSLPDIELCDLIRVSGLVRDHHLALLPAHDEVYSALQLVLLLRHQIFLVRVLQS